MSLELIKDQIAFDHLQGVFDPTYFDYSSSIPPPYLESLSNINQFYYDVTEDVYYLWAWFDTKYWPSWSVARFKFNASTGDLITREDGSIWNTHYTYFASTGTGGYLFVTRNDRLYVYGATAGTLALNGFVTNDWRYTNPSIWKIYRYATVNTIDHLMIGAGNGSFDVYDYTVPEKKWWLPGVGVVQSLTMEDTELLWAAHTNGLITKVNYKKNRYEVITTLQYGDIPLLDGIRISYDTNRKRLGVFLVIPDAADGSCQCRIQFYNLIPQSAILTDPVPLSAVEPGKTVSFAMSVVGDAGEPISGKSVTCSLTPPAQGTLYDGLVYTDVTGQTTTRYKSDEPGITETINAQVEV